MCKSDIINDVLDAFCPTARLELIYGGDNCASGLLVVGLTYRLIDLICLANIF